MPHVLDDKSYFLIVPDKFGNCPYHGDSDQAKDWQAEKTFYDRIKHCLEKFQADNQNLSVIYFHGLVHAGISQHGGVTPKHSPAAKGHKDGQKPEEHEADGVILVRNNKSGTFLCLVHFIHVRISNVQLHLIKTLTIHYLIIRLASKYMKNA
jgi:hypothetical protein